MTYNPDITNVIIRLDDKTTPGTIAKYNGSARPGEIVIDPTVIPPTIWIGDKTGSLSLVTGGGGGGSSIANSTTPTSNVITTSTGVTVGAGGNTVITVTDTAANIAGGLNVAGNTNLGPVSNLTITGGSPGQLLTTDGSGNLSWTTVTGGANIQPIIEWSAGSDASGLTFTDANVATFTNNTYAAVYVNGSLLSPADYVISGTTLTVNAYLNTGDNIIIGPTGGGGGGGAGNISSINLNGNGSTYLAGNGTWATISGGGVLAAGPTNAVQLNSGTSGGNAFIASGNLVFADTGVVPTLQLQGQILASKRVQASSFFPAMSGGGIFSVNTGTGIAPDLFDAQVFKYTANDNFTFNNMTYNGFVLNSGHIGVSAKIIIVQDATGGRVMSSTMKFLGGVNTLSTAPGAVDIIDVLWDGTAYYAELKTGYV